MLKSKYKDFYGSGFFLIVACVFGYMSANTPAGLSSGLGADFLPKLVSLLIGLLSFCLFLTAFSDLKKARPAEAKGTAKPETKKSDEEKKEATRPFIHVALTFAYLFFFILLLDHIGFIITTPIYLFLQIYTIAPKERRKPVQYAIIAVASTLLVYAVFTYGFSIVLPAGLLK